MRRHGEVIGFTALVLAAGLLCTAVLTSGPERPVYLLGVLSLAGWFAAILLYVSFSSTVNSLARAIGTTHHGTDAAQELLKDLEDVKRCYRAGFALRQDQAIGEHDVVFALQRLQALALEVTGARAAELSLAENATGVCSQALLLGVPRSAESQAMLAEDHSLLSGTSTDASGGTVIVREIRYCGQTFGTLRLEMPEGYRESESDSRVLDLLAVQSAIVLLNARFTEELLKLKRHDEESVRAKTGFLANLSHEIRGPLGIIINGVELGLDGLCGEIPVEMQKTLRMIKESGSHLLDLVNDVLDYAKIESGKVVPKPVEIGVKGLLEDLSAVVRSQAVAKKHKLTLEPVDRKLGMVCEKRHARQMLINLLTNAIKYTPEGGAVTIRAERYIGSRVKVSVQDTGIGIPEDQRSKVFNAFERVDDQYAQTQVGTGLGMPLTRKLAEANGGRVDFESEVGKGSTFFLILPSVELEEPGELEDGEGNGAPRQHFGRGERVLLVDPDSAVRELAEKFLAAQGFAVLLAANGREVMKMLREEKVELAIVENDLPDLSGEELVAAIRANPRAAGLPLILVSSKAFVFDIERFLKLGVDRCVSKPFELGELAYTVRRLIDETKGVPSPQAK